MAPLIFNLGIHICPCRSTQEKDPQYTLNERMDGPQGGLQVLKGKKNKKSTPNAMYCI